MHAFDELTRWFADAQGAGTAILPGVMQATKDAGPLDFFSLVHLHDDGTGSTLAFRAELDDQGSPVIAVRRFDGERPQVGDHAQRWMHRIV